METYMSDVKLQDIKKSIVAERKRLLFRRITGNRTLFFGLTLILIMFLVSLVGPIIIPYSPLETDPINRLQAPGTEHLFGTDNYGRDLLTRVVYGARLSFTIGFIVAITSSSIGLVLGLYSAYYNILDHIIMRIVDGLMAFPAILLAIALIGALGPSTTNLLFALIFISIPGVARVVRSCALVVKEQTYIEAMKAIGASSTRIIWSHIAPGTFSALLVQATFIFAVSIIIEAALSFLGVGVPAPAPSLGNILSVGKDLIRQAWWMTVFPGITFILLVLGLNMSGDGLRDSLDPNIKFIMKD